jgi:hypothetical protein
MIYYLHKVGLEFKESHIALLKRLYYTFNYNLMRFFMNKWTKIKEECYFWKMAPFQVKLG